MLFSRAARATTLGLFADEIIPVVTTIKDKDGNEKQIKVRFFCPTITITRLCNMLQFFQLKNDNFQLKNLDAF